MKLHHAIRLFLITHHIPVALNDDAVVYYRFLARVHGRRLERCTWGRWIIL